MAKPPLPWDCISLAKWQSVLSDYVLACMVDEEDLVKEHGFTPEQVAGFREWCLHIEERDEMRWRSINASPETAEHAKRHVADLPEEERGLAALQLGVIFDEVLKARKR